jgi:hypothetical protein
MDTLTIIEALTNDERSLALALTEARADCAELEWYVTNLAGEIGYLHQELAVLQTRASCVGNGHGLAVKGPSFFELLKGLFAPQPALPAARSSR